MNLWSLIGREIGYRKTGFIIGLICVAVAIGSLVGAITLLEAHDARTEQILTQRERETREEMEKLEDSYRLIMRDLGHNVMILHEDQSRARLRVKGYPDTYMPEEYAQQLGEGRTETLNHLLPVLQEKITWPKREIEIILSGTPGQTPVAHRARFLTEDGGAYKNPIVDPIPEGALRVGHSVAEELRLRPGDTVTLMEEEFVIDRIGPYQGTDEDIMVWCNLEKAQQWLDQEGRINAIFALECICEADAIGRVREDVNRILPDVQVVEFSTRVVARAEARQRAEEEAKRAIAAEIAHRSQMGEERRAFASVLVPIILLASGLWVFFLILGNVRERETEIGILRAVGVKDSKIMAVFLVKAGLIGVLSAVVGYVGGVSAGAVWGGMPFLSAEFFDMFGPRLFLAALIVAPALCGLAGWIPAVKAAHKDPADVLREDCV